MGRESRSDAARRKAAPVDSSAAAIAAQGLVRLGHAIGKEGERYRQAGLTIAQSLLREPYLSTDPQHEGILLHSIYHRPNGWDYIPKGSKVPFSKCSATPGTYFSLT